MTDVAEIETAIADAATGIGAARVMLSQGQTIDLAGLERHISGICERIEALPLDQRENLKSPLVALIDDLTALTGILNELYEKIAAELQDRTSRQQALSAYGSQPDKAGSGGPSDKG